MLPVVLFLSVLVSLVIIMWNMWDKTRRKTPGGPLFPSLRLIYQRVLGILVTVYAVVFLADNRSQILPLLSLVASAAGTSILLRRIRGEHGVGREDTRRWDLKLRLLYLMVFLGFVAFVGFVIVEGCGPVTNGH